MTTKNVVLAAAIALAAATQAHATTYTYSTFQAPGSTGATAAQGINKNGVISGWFQDSAGTHGFTKTGSTYTVINYPGSTYTIVRGINDNTQAVGYSTVPFKWSAGTFSTLSVPNASWVGPIGINNGGTVSGQYSTSDGLYHGFVLSSSSFTQLNVPNAKAGTTAAGGTNNLGKTVGWYTDTSGKLHGFLYSSGTYTTLDYPGAPAGTVALGINDNGQIVGYYLKSTQYPVAFVYSGGVYTELDPVSAGGPSEAWAINNAGVIVGQIGSSAAGAFVATPH